MKSSFKIIGFSAKNTTIELREKITFNEVTTKQLIETLNSNFGATDVLILSTCNRTEIYYNHDTNLNNEIALSISIINGISKDLVKESLNTYYEGEDAINHLFEVSMGLQAQVIGDIQISNQVKTAYKWSTELNASGPFLHRLMHTIFYANKRVVQETSFRDGAASISYATKELIFDIIPKHQSPKILILGLGEIGKDVCKNLSGNANSVTIANRTLSKAIELANECDFQAISFDKALKRFDNFDVIVSSVAHNTPIIDRTFFDKSNILSHKLLIDLSVPRSIDRNVEQINGLLLYNIDSIQLKASSAKEKRIAAIPSVKSIIRESISSFKDWSKEMTVSPTIKKIKYALENIRKEEIKKYLKNSNDENYQIVEEVTKSMMQKIIKLPVLQLKDACKRGEADTLIGVLNDLFDLEKKASSDKISI